MTWDDFLNYKLLQLGDFKLIVGNLMIGLVILAITWLSIFLLRKAITRPRFIIDKIDQKRRTSIFLIIKYFVWVIAIVIFMEVIGVKVTVLMVGSTALLVGLGLGLQNIFTDLVSGLFLLFEGTVKVGDILEVDGVIGRVKEINLRSSEIQTRDDMTFIIPNSRFVVEKVVNWSHTSEKVRFIVKVGIPYGSDIDQVEAILLDSMKLIKRIEKTPEAFVRLVNFGDNALEYEMIFWSKYAFESENVKSELRRAVYRKLNEQGLAIPFPQRDVNIRGIDEVVKKFRN